MRKPYINQCELICPQCRHAGKNSMIQFPLELEIVRGGDDFIQEGFLTCSNSYCRRRYPVIEDVPIILKNIEKWWHSEKTKLSTVRSASNEMYDYFKHIEHNSQLYGDERNVLSSYMELHYGMFADKPAFSDGFPDSQRFWDMVIESAKPEESAKYSYAIDLGCSVGRYTFELARFSDMAIGIDLNFNAVKTAARLRRLGKVRYERKRHGRCYEEINTSYEPRKNVLFIVADSLDPPFRAESFDLVAGLNLMDNLGLPLVLIGQMDALLRPGGKLITSSPYEWRSDICDPAEWLETGDMDTPIMLRRILEGGLIPQMGFDYSILKDVSDIPWPLRNHDRYWSLFLVHFLASRKNNAQKG